MSIDIEQLRADLQKSRTDDRFIRALMTFAEHINQALERMTPVIEDIADDRISEHSRREAYYKALEGS